MIHHGCVYNDAEIGFVKAVVDDPDKQTVALMGYDGRYRCGECKRRVQMDVSDEAYTRDVQSLPKVEPPYPDGWCK